MRGVAGSGCALVGAVLCVLGGPVEVVAALAGRPFPPLVACGLLCFAIGYLQRLVAAAEGGG